MDPRPTTLKELKLVGIETRTSNADESDPAKARIPGLWKKFYEDGISKKTPEIVTPEMVFAVYTNYESDHNGKYSLILTSEVKNLKQIPEGFTGITVPPSKYLVFLAKGKLPEAIIETWKEVWKYFSQSRDHKRTYAADFEIYDKRAQWDVPEVDICISIR